MAKAKKLPSGNWMVQVSRNGMRKAFTDSDKFIAQQKAMQWLASNPRSSDSNLTFRQAAEKYNHERKNVLSPSTMAEYERMAEKSLPFSDVKCSLITQSDVQEYINRLARTHSPKTCRNRHSYISSVLSTQRPDFSLKTKLPAKIPLNYKTPSDERVKRLLRDIKGTKYELPVLLAAFGSLRRSEICALHTSDVDRNKSIIHVRQAAVQEKGGNLVIKKTKTRAGDRFVQVPKYVIDLMPDSGYVCGGLLPNTLETYWGQIKRKYGVGFRFHDLRHYFASSQHAIGVPDAYIMKAGGWESDTVLKGVYRNALDDVAQKMSNKAVDHYQRLIE